MTVQAHAAFQSRPALETAQSVVALEPGAGEHVWFLDHLVTVKLRGAAAPWGVIEVALPAGARTPFHRHEDDDETLIVLEGDLTLFLEGGSTVRGRAGSCVHLPRGIAHGFRTETPLRMLVVCRPDGFVEFTRDYGVPAPRPEYPPNVPPDFPRLEALSRKHHIELLGPLPEGAL